MGSLPLPAHPVPSAHPLSLLFGENIHSRKLVRDTSNMIEIETTAPPSHMYNIYSPPGKMKRSEDDEEEKSVSSDHRVPTMVERREEVNSLLGTHPPFSSMMRRMAAKYQRPSSLQTPSNLNLPLLSSPLHLSSHPYSRLIATLASSYSSPPNPHQPQPQTSPPPQPKRMREESPIDLSPTAADSSEDLLDVVSVDDAEEKKVRQEEQEERRERAQKLQRLIAAAMFHSRGQR